MPHTYLLQQPLVLKYGLKTGKKNPSGGFDFRKGFVNNMESFKNFLNNKSTILYDVVPKTPDRTNVADHLKYTIKSSIEFREKLDNKKIGFILEISPQKKYDIYDKQDVSVKFIQELDSLFDSEPSIKKIETKKQFSFINQDELIDCDDDILTSLIKKKLNFSKNLETLKKQMKDETDEDVKKEQEIVVTKLLNLLDKIDKKIRDYEIEKTKSLLVEKEDKLKNLKSLQQSLDDFKIDSPVKGKTYASVTSAKTPSEFNREGPWADQVELDEESEKALKLAIKESEKTYAEENAA